MIQFPEAVFFDWDGTLADSLVFLEDAHNHTRDRLGYPSLPKGDFALKYFGRPREILYTELYAPHQDKAKATFEAYVRENHLKLQPLPDAEQVLKFFAERGVPMGVVSNKKAEFIKQEIENFGWNGYFRSYVGAAEAAQDKPAADPLLLAISRAGLQSDISSIWYVGDTEVDLACARATGCVPIYISHIGKDDDIIEKYRPEVTVRNCSEFHGFLLQSYGK